MQRAEAVTTIPASPAEVFALVADPANLPTWQTGILSARQTSSGPIGRGSTARVVRELLGQRITADLSMIAYEPDRRLVLESTVSGVRAEATLELTPVDHATRILFTMDFRAASRLMFPLEGVVARAAERDLANSLERLRTHFTGAGREGADDQP